MATGINRGMVATDDPISNRLKVDMKEPIRMLDPDTAQFSTMLMDDRLRGEDLNSYIKEWLEDRLLPRMITLGASASNTDTALTTAAGEAAYAKTGDIIRFPSTGEPMRVLSSNGTTGLTVVRAINGSTAVSLPNASVAIIVGGSNSQGAGLPTRLITQQVRNFNYSNITRNSYGFTRTARQSGWYGGNILEYEREKKATEHKADIEHALFFGARSYSGSSPDTGNPIHTAGGVLDFLTAAQVTDAGGTFDKGELQDFLTAGLQYGSRGSKVFFVSPAVSQVMGEFVQDNWIQAPPKTKFFGASVDYLISAAFAGQTVPVVVKTEWGAFGTGTAGQYGSMGFLIDMDSVSLCTMQPSVLLKNREANDIDGSDEEYLAEWTLVVQWPEHHRLLKNVTG